MICASPSVGCKIEAKKARRIPSIIEGVRYMVELTVESVRINLQTSQRVVILNATKQERYLFIWIAHPEAYAIANELQGRSSARPLTVDVLNNNKGDLGTRLHGS